MSRAARVTSIDRVRDFRSALCDFGKDAKDSLAAAEMHLRRAADWLGERLKYWQREIRVREEELVRAKSELTRREQAKRQGAGPGTADQEKAFRVAQMRLKEAEEKLKSCRRWGPLLQHAINEYHGPARVLSAALDSQLVQALGLLDRKLEDLEAYLRVAVPGRPTPAATTAPAEPAPAEPTPSPAPAPTEGASS